MLKTAKRGAKILLRSLGVEAHSFIPGASNDAQLLAAMSHFGITQVFDIGANQGQFGLQLIDIGYRGAIVSVEPLAEAHAVLCQVAARHPGWTVTAPVAVGAQAGEVVFHVSENSVSSSALEVLDLSVHAAPGSRQVERRVVPMTTVDALARAHGVSAAGAMLKIDTQGFESAVLDGATDSLSQFELVLLELSLAPLYAGQHLWLEMVQRMAGAGYGIWSFQPEFIDPATGQTLQVNGLFSKAGRNPKLRGGAPE